MCFHASVRFFLLSRSSPYIKKITKQRDNNNQEQVKEKHGKVACRQKTLLQCVAGKYLWSCHGTRSQLRILFKQSLSEHAEGDEDTVSL